MNLWSYSAKGPVAAFAALAHAVDLGARLDTQPEDFAEAPVRRSSRQCRGPKKPIRRGRYTGEVYLKLD
jgi:hypothetical protein